jgi:hypothetical protein
VNAPQAVFAKNTDSDTQALGEIARLGVIANNDLEIPPTEIRFEEGIFETLRSLACVAEEVAGLFERIARGRHYRNKGI